MADPAGISGIRATGLRPVAILKKDNYRSWSVKLKVQLKVMCEIFIALNEYCLDAMRQCNIVIRRISHEEELVR